MAGKFWRQCCGEKPANTTMTKLTDICSADDSDIADVSGGMQMVFTSEYLGAPILFSSWAPKSAGAFAGSFIAVFLAAFCFRTIVFLKSYLTTEYWSKTVGVSSPLA